MTTFLILIALFVTWTLMRIFANNFVRQNKAEIKRLEGDMKIIRTKYLNGCISDDHYNSRCKSLKSKCETLYKSNIRLRKAFLLR